MIMKEILTAEEAEQRERLMKIVKSTPTEERPKINYNGVVDFMNDEQYFDYLKMQEDYPVQEPERDPRDVRIEKLEEQILKLTEKLNV